MATTISQDLTAWRTANQNHGGLAKQLNINGTLYDIQDAAVDELASKVDTALASINATITDSIIGTAQDDGDDLTLYGIKAFAQSLVDNLAGTNWSDNAKKVQEIIAEIEGSDNGWTTLVDKLKGLGDNTVAEYVLARENAIKAIIEDNERVTAAALNDLQSSKANKDAIASGSVNNLTPSFNQGVIDLSSTAVSVYVPVSGKTL